MWNNPARGIADLDHAGGGADDLGIDPRPASSTRRPTTPNTPRSCSTTTPRPTTCSRTANTSAGRTVNSGYEEGDPLESREALGKALFAGGSGIDPDDPQGHYVEHTPEQKQVMSGALERLAGEKNDFPPELRVDMANLIGNHGEDAHKTMSSKTETGR